MIAPANMGALLSELGLSYIRDRGDEIWASCPSHKDSGDSWSINRHTGMHSCFACHYTGNLNGLVMDMRPDLTIWKAADLIQSFGLLMATTEMAERIAQGPTIKRPRSIPFVATQELLRFKDPPPEMLAARHISPESAAVFGVRWNSRRDAWILPIRSPGGVLLGWQEKGPDTVRNLPVDMEKSATVFGANLLNSCSSLIIVESPLDACRLHTLGYTDVVAMFGASVSDPQMKICLEYADQFVFALDNDQAGIQNTARLIDGRTWNQRGREKQGRAWGFGLPSRIINYGDMKAKDIGEMTADEVHWSIENASFVSDWLFTVARQNRPVKSRR